MLQKLLNLLLHKTQSLSQLADSLGIDQYHLKLLFSKLEDKGLTLKIDKNGEVSIPKNIKLLSRDIIESVLSEVDANLVNLDCHLLVGSTNQILLDSSPHPKKLCVCTAEWQSEGRGRQNRQWFSPLAKNLLFSIGRQWQQKQPAIEAGILGLLSLIAGVAVATTLKKLGLEQIKLKWPNDVVIRNSNLQLEKIAGILVESKSDGKQGNWVVGIGLNVKDMTHWKNHIDQNITSFGQLTHGDFSREVLLAGIIENWLMLEKTLLTQGATEILNRWREFDTLFGEQIILQSHRQQSFTGVAKGIDDEGLLKVETEYEGKGKMVVVHSGDVKVRIRDVPVS